MDAIREAAQETGKAVDSGVRAASELLLSGAHEAAAQYQATQERSERFLDTAVSHYRSTEQAAFDKLKEGVAFVREHQAASTALAAGAALVILPGPRRILWRQTLGRLRSKEAQYQAIETRARQAQETLTQQEAEAVKLEQRLAAAREQYDSGLSKLRSTARQLESLASQVRSTERTGRNLILDLRELPSKQALGLRSEVAMQVAAAKRQAAILDKQVWGLVKKGVY
ncbi:hypothetical protein WJX81_002663 [Elliptochloris bilobata]|uniref:Phage tail tape measure protein n=1 Tax=Elliptochloris bilobata TaxID=381761 RepID=A0AAW1RTC8_9CHLO